MSHVYGDSTPFPYDVDYIDLSRFAVECAVQLMSAQHAIATSLSRGEHIGEDRRGEINRINAMARAVRSALEPFNSPASAAGERVAARMLECIEGTASTEVAALEQQTADEGAHIQHIVACSRESAQRALEAFLVRHDLPGTELALSWSSAGEQGHAASVEVKTPFGIQAVFSLAIPADHLWSRARRVSDLSPGLEVQFPQQSGWLSKRVEMAPLKLDRLYVSAVELDVNTAEFRLRKSPSAGAGYRVRVTLEDEQKVEIQPLGEDGAPDGDAPLTLDRADSTGIMSFCARVVESTRDLAGMRRSMTRVHYEGEALNGAQWPEAVAERLIAQLAPVVNEIALRSGAPGELVLRRDVGGGRREEVYVTKAELYEKVLVLPPSRRASFERLGLHDPRSSSGAPAPARSARALAPTELDLALTPGPA